MSNYESLKFETLKFVNVSIWLNKLRMLDSEAGPVSARGFCGSSQGAIGRGRGRHRKSLVQGIVDLRQEIELEN